MSGPVRAEPGAFFLTAMVTLIDDKLASARGRSSAALRDIDAGDLATGMERLREAAPALAELQSLLQAALALGRTLPAGAAQAQPASTTDAAA